MDVLCLFVLLGLRTLWRGVVPWLPRLAAAIGIVVFLPMVVLGALGIQVWHGIISRRALGRHWLVALAALAAMEYLAARFLLAADPLQLYLTAHLGFLRLIVLSFRDQPQWSSWQPTFYAMATPAIPPGALVAAMVIWHWSVIWRRPTALGVREARGLDVPWWVARRATHGVQHPQGGWAIGYDEAGDVVVVGDAEARHHTVICGAPGTGKTTIIRHVLDGVTGRCPVVVVDCKASAQLQRAVEAIPGSVVWHLGGSLRWDALQGDPTSLASKLLAAEHYSPDAAIYLAAAERYVQWVGMVLDVAGLPRDPSLIAEILSPPALKRAIRQVKTRLGGATPPVIDHVTRRLNDVGRAEAEGIAGFGCRFGALVEGVAGRSLGTGPHALELETAIRQRRVVLFSLNAAEYGLVAAKIGAWALLDAVRVAGRLQATGWSADHQCYLVIDEFSALAREGRHVVPLLARGREAGLACVVATQGLADFTRVAPSLAQELVQNTAVKILLRQGSAQDSSAWARHLGQYEREELSRQLDDRGASLGRNLTRWRSDYYVSPEELHALSTGEAVVSIAPLGHTPRRLTWVRLAQPSLA